jgi:hypothetical protein
LLVLQHIWSRWTKASRGGAEAKRRLVLAEAYPLPHPPADAAPPAWAHEVWALEDDGFAVRQRAGPITHEDWERTEPLHAANLRWSVTRDQATLSLLEPWPSLRRTPWPAHLPSPLTTLHEGEVVRIDWNARFASSAGGSDGSYFFEQHAVWAAFARAPAKDLFLTAEPRKRFDFTTRIY